MGNFAVMQNDCLVLMEFFGRKCILINHRERELRSRFRSLFLSSWLASLSQKISKGLHKFEYAWGVKMLNAVE